jgi:hypothetical protein
MPLSHQGIEHASHWVHSYTVNHSMRKG